MHCSVVLQCMIAQPSRNYSGNVGKVWREGQIPKQTWLKAEEEEPIFHMSSTHYLRVVT